jgi:LmbE family N-acetylglucosaminyl deacetylase
MQHVSLIDQLPRGGTVLCLGAHSDDIEIGCGGTVQKLLAARPDLGVHWIVFTARGEREREAKDSATHMLSNAAASSVKIMGFRNGFFPYVAADIKEFFETLKPVEPHLILTHYRHDLHQDHRVIAELTWNTFRSHLVLEYEVPKYDGDLGSPNVFVDLTEKEIEGKVDVLMRFFKTQHDKQWFTADTFKGLSRLRGIESNSPTGYAEAFYGRKLLFR